MKLHAFRRPAWRKLGAVLSVVLAGNLLPGGVSLCLAGLVVNVIDEGSPAAGLHAYTFQVMGTDGEKLAGIRLMTVDGVHQVWQNENATQQTPLDGDSEEGPMGLPGTNPLDTHLLIVPGGAGTITSPGFGLEETNDMTDPADLAGLGLLTPANPFEAFVGSAGVGSLDFTGDDATIGFQPPLPEMLDYLYLVRVEGSSSSVSMELVGDGSTSGGMDYHWEIPEASGIMMGGAGLVSVGLYALGRPRRRLVLYEGAEG